MVKQRGRKGSVCDVLHQDQTQTIVCLSDHRPANNLPLRYGPVHVRAAMFKRRENGYSMIVFLSFAIFLTIASTTLLHGSGSTAIMSIFVILLTAAGMVIVLVSVLLVQINNFSKSTRIPCLIITTMRVLKCKTKDDPSDSGSIDSDGEEVPFTWKHVADFLDILVTSFSRERWHYLPLYALTWRVSVFRCNFWT
ncbi:hypothetical protein DPMN_006398 [Dreissena polymorpha]|uniref:Uncharacterized protein n=1 Tax=Dreissena polymorpha TaxID=45954 RepID=A0A9D4MU20_DREPO|nr:hypothetical protein DPMN_006398 [Dreissena polymorpha]